jgi:AcrR family transcriptional regulator
VTNRSNPKLARERTAGDRTGPRATPFDHARVDGRARRGHRSRERILDATIELIERGNPAPTSRQIAECAGISVGSLNYHFPRGELLFCSALERKLGDCRSLVARLPPTLPPALRIRALCHQRNTLFEGLCPMLRAAQSRANTSAAVAKLLLGVRTLLRDQVAQVFGPEVSSQGAGAENFLDALASAVGWQSWDEQRSQAGHSAVVAEQIFVHNLTKLLSWPPTT